MGGGIQNGGSMIVGLTYSEIVKVSEERKKLVRSFLKKQPVPLSMSSKTPGILDAFHGEGFCGPALTAQKAVVKAFDDSFADPGVLREANGVPYDKKQPLCLRKAAAEFCFSNLASPQLPGGGIQVSADEVVVAPYTSTLLFEEVIASLAPQRSGVIICSEGFYKNNAVQCKKYGLEVAVSPALSDDFKISPDNLRSCIQRHKKLGHLRGVALTLPGNPVIADYTMEEMVAIATVVAEENVKVVCDSVFAAYDRNLIPLAGITLKIGNRIERLYDRVFTISGNSKSHGASGPCKFGTGCTGDSLWRQKIINQLTLNFQRETTHLVKALFENTPAEYFDNNLRMMENAQQRSR